MLQRGEDRQQGQIGNQTSCTGTLDEAGVSKDVAAKACRVAPQ